MRGTFDCTYDGMSHPPGKLSTRGTCRYLMVIMTTKPVRTEASSLHIDRPKQ